MNRDSPAAGELLEAWERGAVQRGARRALSLLAAATPHGPLEELRTESIGTRDGRLLDLRQCVFGPRLDCVTECPRCDQPLEFELFVDDVRVGQPPDRAPVSVHIDRFSVTFRLPDSNDLIAVERESPNPEDAARSLLQRCVLRATADGEPVDPAQLPAEVVGLVEEAMSEEDPQADIDVSFACPRCGSSWKDSFDIAGFLWEELDSWARREVRDVHTLAAAYGWREADILAMSEARRGAYLDLVRE